jgi:hypothetical protein
VPEGTDRKKRASINVTPAVLAKLNAYQAALDREMQREASHAKIISALLDGVPLWQADLMIGAYPEATDSTDTD